MNATLDYTLTLRVHTTMRRRGPAPMPASPRELVRVTHRGVVTFEVEDVKDIAEGAGYRQAGYVPGQEWRCPHPDHEQEAA